MKTMKGILVILFCCIVAAYCNDKEKISDNIVNIEENSKQAPPPTISPAEDGREADSSSETENEKPKPSPNDSSGSNNEDSEHTSESTAKEENGYKNGSICSYCKYCKLCNLCEEKCPCEKSTSEHCDMCKYCKYCNFCGTVCDTVCTPGSFLDIFSSAVYDALPTFSDETKKDINEDIEKAKNFIKEYL